MTDQPRATMPTWTQLEHADAEVADAEKAAADRKHRRRTLLDRTAISIGRLRFSVQDRHSETRVCISGMDATDHLLSKAGALQLRDWLNALFPTEQYYRADADGEEAEGG